MQDLISDSSPLPWTQILIKLLQPKQNKIATTSTYFSGEGNGNPSQYSCLENPMDGGAWWAAVYGVAQSQTWLKQLSSSSSHILPIPTFHKLTTQYNSSTSILLLSYLEYFLNFLACPAMDLKGFKKYCYHSSYFVAYKYCYKRMTCFSIYKYCISNRFPYWFTLIG